MSKEKRYTCRICKEKFLMVKWKYAQRSLTAFKGVCESIECGAQAGMRAVEKKRKAEAKVKRKKDYEAKQDLRSIGSWKEDLQKEVNRIVRWLDRDRECISHPEMKVYLRMDAGHGYTVAAHGDIRYNVHNIHAQNSQANERYGGDANYIRGLRNRYGQEYQDMFLALPLKWKGISKCCYSIDQIRYEYLPKAREINRMIKDESKTDWTRDMVNEYIGIYTNQNLEIIKTYK